MAIMLQQKKCLNENIDVFQGIFPYLIFLTTSFFVYIKTICPTIYWRDSPEFANIGYTLGIAHPNGSPAYLLISKIVTFVPMGSIAFKINLVSLLFATCSVLVLFKIILLLIYLCFDRTDEKLANISALLATLIIIFSQSFWMTAVVAEVYTMNILGICLIFYFAVRWVKTRKKKFLFLATFLYGLSIGVHGGMVIFFPFFFLFFLLVEWQKSATNLEHLLKKTLILSFLFIFGFSVFIFLPIRSTTNPTFDSGNPETLPRFINHLIDKKDSPSFISDTGKLSSISKKTKNTVKLIIRELTLIGFICGIIGFFYHIKGHKKAFLLCFLLFSVNILFFLSANIRPLLESIVFLPSIIIFSFWVGLGIYKIVEVLSHYLFGYYLKRVFFILLSGFIFFSFLNDYNDLDKSTYYLAEEAPKKIYHSMEPNSAVFSTMNWLPFRYFQDIENLKQDTDILLISDLKNPGLFNPISAERFPNMNLAPFNSNDSNFIEYTTALIKLNIKSKHIYTGFNRPLNNLKGTEILPYKGFLAKVSLQNVEDKKTVIDIYLDELRDLLEENINSKDFIFDQDIGARTYYATYLSYISDYLVRQSRFKDAEFFIKIAANINRSADRDMMEILGACYINLNDFEKAEELFLLLVDQQPTNHWYYYSLGVVYMKMGKLEKAKNYLKKSLALSENFSNYRLALKQVNIQISKKNKFNQ